ncbi:MAG: hypothetical protein MZU79_07290 [Anaerotruncus sp.]|nr:hypothetical protein [Anaerotruncus sp.]
MSDKLEAYLEEISHFLSGRAEREEILGRDPQPHPGKGRRGTRRVRPTPPSTEAIAAFGPARKVAERYLDDRPIIAPAYKRYLFRYTSFLFAVHAALTVLAVVFKKDFVIFPFLFMPRLGIIEALMYLPTAFLADLGVVAVVLYFITQSGKDIKLPWPKLAVDLDEVKPPKKSFWPSRVATAVGAVVMLALTDFALYLFARHQHHLLRQLRLGRPASALHARRRTRRLAHRHRHVRRLDHGPARQALHPLPLGRRRVQRRHRSGSIGLLLRQPARRPLRRRDRRPLLVQVRDLDQIHGPLHAALHRPDDHHRAHQEHRRDKPAEARRESALSRQIGDMIPVSYFLAVAYRGR